MSRELYLNVSQSFVTAECLKENVGISSIKSLPDGGTRLVCMSVKGAGVMREKLAKNIAKGELGRERHGPGWGFVTRD